MKRSKEMFFISDTQLCKLCQTLRSSAQPSRLRLHGRVTSSPGRGCAAASASSRSSSTGSRASWRTRSGTGSPRPTGSSTSTSARSSTDSGLPFSLSTVSQVNIICDNVILSPNPNLSAETVSTQVIFALIGALPPLCVHVQHIYLKFFSDEN